MPGPSSTAKSAAKTPTAPSPPYNWTDASRTPTNDTFVIATWNVNSLRMREERVLAWLAENQPDVLCLQELKLQEADFPTASFRSVGYSAVAFGQKSYNGVAILSRLAHGTPSEVVAGMADGDPDAEARLLIATIPGLATRVASVYVPNGQTIDSDKYAYKLRWLKRLHEYLAKDQMKDQVRQPSAGPLVLCGDFNIAPGDQDVYDPAGWRDTVICHADARAALSKVMGLGFIDLLRKVYPAETVYTYWDYRGLSFPKNLGLRIDHVLAPAALADRCVDARVDRQARKGDKPSDHVPVLVRFRRQ
jgi:exodeoxyribonuclease-3